jgi:hypothetical protein
MRFDVLRWSSELRHPVVMWLLMFRRNLLPPPSEQYALGNHLHDCGVAPEDHKSQHEIVYFVRRTELRNFAFTSPAMCWKSQMPPWIVSVFITNSTLHTEIPSSINTAMMNVLIHVKRFKLLILNLFSEVRGLIKNIRDKILIEKPLTVSKWQPCRILGNISWHHIPEERVAAWLSREWVDLQCNRVCSSVVLWNGCVEGATCLHQFLPETW